MLAVSMGIRGYTMGISETDKYIALVMGVSILLILIGIQGVFFLMALYGAVRGIYIYYRYSQQKSKEVISTPHTINLGGNVWAPLKSLASMGISGIPGSGKSTYATYLLKQVNMPIVVCDIHYPDTQSLGARIEAEGIVCQIVSEVPKIKEVLSEGFSDRLIVIDEYTSLLRADKDIKSLVLNTTQQGRKYRRYCWLIGQHWNAKASGGTEIRDSLLSFAVLNQRKQQAKVATGIDSASLPDTSKLRHGEVLCIVYQEGIQEVVTYK